VFLASRSRWTESVWISYLSGGFDGGSILEQELHHLDSVLLASNVQWGEAILSTNTSHDLSTLPAVYPGSQTQQPLWHLPDQCG